MYSTKGGFIYLLTNKNHTVLYTGVTTCLKERIEQHKTTSIKGSFHLNITVTGWFTMKAFLTSVRQLQKKKG